MERNISEPTTDRLRSRSLVQQTEANVNVNAGAGGTAPVEVTRTVELPDTVVEEIAELADDPRHAHDLACDAVDERVEFTTPDGQPIADVVDDTE